jgi:hypothetical protein
MSEKMCQIKNDIKIYRRVQNIQPRGLVNISSKNQPEQKIRAN